MEIYRRRKTAGIALLLVLLLPALFLLLRTEKTVRAEGGVAAVTAQSGETAEYLTLSGALADWTAGSTLRLLADCVADATISVSEEKTLDLNGFRLSFTGAGRTVTVQTEGDLTITDTASRAEGVLSGGGVRVRGMLTLSAGNLSENAAEDGGGVYVDEGGSFVMQGGSVSENTATGNGGGVYVHAGGSFTMQGGNISSNTAAGNGGGVYLGGSLRLGAGARIAENRGARGERCNLYLPVGANVFAEEGFSGSVGVSMASVGVFAQSGSAKCFYADDLTYAVKESDGTLSLGLSPLASVTAECEPEETIFPRSSADTIEKYLSLVGVNENGAPYPAEKLLFALSLPEGGLAVGENELLVTATGEDGEQVQTSVFVSVAAPVLTGITVQFEPGEKLFYFDDGIASLQEYLTVTGSYTDGYSRPLGRTAQETSEGCGESYIVDFCELPEGTLAEALQEPGLAVVTVTAGEYSAKFRVDVSKYVLNASDMVVQNVTIVEGAGVEARDFVPSLPAGITPVVSLSDGAELTAPAAGNYTATITFEVADPDNYEPVEGSLTAELTVLRAELSCGDGTCVLSSKNGIPPEWELSVKDVTDSAEAPALGSELDCKQIYEFLLRDDGEIVNGATEQSYTVRILLSEELRGKDVRLYRMLSDGTVTEIEAVRDGDWLSFECSRFTARYAVATDSGFGAYLALTILFGVVCVAGAGLLLWFFRVRRKLK